MKGLLQSSTLIPILFLALLLQPVVLFPQNPSTFSRGKNYKFINGQWFDGRRFHSETFYSVDGILTKRAPSQDTETIDLEGKYVVPPYAEAHNHNLGGGIYFNRDATEKVIRRYLADGVFYVKTPGNPVANASILREQLTNRPDSVDVSLANGVLTSKDGHPIGMTIASFKQAGATAPSVTELEGKILFVIESEGDLSAKWNRIMEGKPDFIKTILCHRENFQKRRGTESLVGYNGLDPKLLPLIVKRAHAASLRVTAHIDSAADFAAAVRADVDEIAHLPGYHFEPGTTEADYLITPDVARTAAKRGTIVVTTANIATYYAKGEELARVQAVQRKNIELLITSGVRLAVGSDDYADTSVAEAMYLKSLKVLDNREILNMWCVTSAQTTFPRRKIGYLREGYEASFVVLNGNPIEKFGNVREIKMRFKQGVPINVTR